LGPPLDPIGFFGIHMGLGGSWGLAGEVLATRCGSKACKAGHARVPRIGRHAKWVW